MCRAVLAGVVGRRARFGRATTPANFRECMQFGFDIDHQSDGAGTTVAALPGVVAVVPTKVTAIRTHGFARRCRMQGAPEGERHGIHQPSAWVRS